MTSTCNQDITLVSKFGQKLQVSKNLLEVSSTYIHQVLSNSKSTVLVFPDVQFEDLTDLIEHVQFGKDLKENLHAVALKYGFKYENVKTSETYLPLKKRPLEFSIPASPDNHNLVIDDELSPGKPSISCNNTGSPETEDSLASFLPWPILLQQVAMQKMSHQNSLQDLNFSSNSALYPPSSIFSGKSSNFKHTKCTQNKNSQDLINCEECGKMFNASNLLIHKRRVHRHLKEPVKCCGQTFPTRWHLTEHRKSGDHLPTLWKSENLKCINSPITTI